MRKALAATLILASVAAIVAGLAAVNAVNYALPLHWGRGPGGPWFNNTQITTSETSIEGIVSDADWGYLVITTSAGEVRVAAPHYGMYKVRRQHSSNSSPKTNLT